MELWHFGFEIIAQKDVKDIKYVQLVGIVFFGFIKDAIRR